MGPKGPVGATGAEGPIGPRGLSGVSGPAGPAGPQGLPGGFGAYGSFLDLQTQTNTSPGNPLPVLLRATELSDGITIVDDTQITANGSGIYNIAFAVKKPEGEAAAPAPPK